MVRRMEIPVRRGYRPDPCRGSIFFVGNATVIIRHNDFTILTDPNFLHAGRHVHLGYGIRSRRLTNPAIEIEDLPHLDFCLLSHSHGDHFDQVAIRRLNKNLPIITTPQAAKVLEKHGFRRLIPLKSWDAAEITKGKSRLLLTSMPGKHAPGILSHLLPPVMGSMLRFMAADGSDRFHLYISGDTLVFPGLNEIPKRYPEIDLALMHLGGTRLLRLLTVTMDAAQGVEALRIIRPRAAIPIHYNDYTVFKSGLDDFREAFNRANLPVDIIYLSHGDTYEYLVPECLARAA